MRVELTDAELARLRNVLRAAAGLFFDDNRRASLGHGIERRLAATGIASVARYSRPWKRAPGASSGRPWWTR